MVRPDCPFMLACLSLHSLPFYSDNYQNLSDSGLNGASYPSNLLLRFTNVIVLMNDKIL